MTCNLCLVQEALFNFLFINRCNFERQLCLFISGLPTGFGSVTVPLSHF